MASEVKIDSNQSISTKVDLHGSSDFKSTPHGMANEQLAATQIDGPEDNSPKVSSSAAGNDAVQVEEQPSNSTMAHQYMDEEINELIRILDSDASRDEKLEALRRIDEYAQTRTDIRIEMDEEESDTESVDSAGSDSFGDIPLPVQPDGIPLPTENTPTSPLDLIPLPLSSTLIDKMQSRTSGTDLLRVKANNSCDEKQVNVSARSTSVKTTSVDPVLHTTASSDTSAALLAKTTLGTITVHLKGKLGSRISKSSVFDLTDENAKEVNRKLARLRKLKRNKVAEVPVVNDSSLVSVAERRILEWKQELMKEQNQRRGRVSISEVSSSVAGPVLKESESTGSGLEKSESTSLIGHSKCSSLDSAIEVPSTSTHVQDDVTVSKLVKSFVKVKNRDDTTELDWPVEMVKSTTMSPKLVYCCNPLYFSFKHLYGKLNSKSTDDVEDMDKSRGTKRKYHKHEKHQKKKKVQPDAVSSSTNVIEGGKKKKSKSNGDEQDSLKAGKSIEERVVADEKDFTKVSLKNQEGTKTEKKKRERLQSKSDKLESSKSNNRLKPGAAGTNVDNDWGNEDLNKVVKDTAKSKWDTSSDSEIESTTHLKAEPKLKKGIKNLAQLPARKSSASAVSLAGGKQSESKKEAHHLGDKKSTDRGRESSERRGSSHRRHSYHRSDDESDSSYSTSCSRYNSSRSKSSVSRSRSRSSYYRRRRRRRSSVYSDSDSDDVYHRRSSRSYSRSRSHSNRRRRTRSYSSYSSRSSSRSYSGRRRRSRSRSHRRVTSPVRRSSPVWKGKQATSSSVVLKPKPVVSLPQTNSQPAEKAAVPLQEAAQVSGEDASKVVNAEQSQDKVVSESLKEDLTSIPTPEEHMRSIPLPKRSKTTKSTDGRGVSFIGPVLPNDHPLARTQSIPLPPTEKFQHIGPNDPLVFRANPPLPPAGSDVRIAGRPPSPPPGEENFDMDDDIAGDEDPIPRMLDVGSLQPAIFLTPDQLDQYQTLQRRAELHARRQQILQETGMDIVDMEEAETETDMSEEQRMQQALLEQLLLEQSQATLIPAVAQTPVIHVPQQQMLASGQSPMTMMVVTSNGNQFMVATSTGQFVQMPMVQGSPSNGGLMNLGGTSLVIPQAGAPIMLNSSAAAAAAFARAQDEAEAAAELEVHKQIQAARLAAATAAAHRQTEWVQVVQMPGGQLAMAPAAGPLHHVGHQILRGGTPTLIRSAGIPINSLQMQQMQMQHHINQLNQQQQTLVHLQGGGGLVSLPAGMMGGMQMVTQQPQPAQYLMGPNGTLLRLIR